MRLNEPGVRAGALALAAFVAIAITAATLLLTSSTPRTAQASAPCPGADVVPAMCVSDATANVGSNVTVGIHLYQVGALGQTGYSFNMKYPLGLTMVALGTSNSCLDSEGGVPPNNALGAGPQAYAAGCTNLPAPGTPHTDCGGAAGCTPATVVFTCSVGGTYTLDLQGASASKHPSYADDQGNIVDILAANAHNGTVTCNIPAGAPTATDTPTPTDTATPTASPTPCVNQLSTPVACSTLPAFTATPTPTGTGTPIATGTSGPGTTPATGNVPAPTVPGGGAAGAGNIRLPNTGQTAGGSASPRILWLVLLVGEIAAVTVGGGVYLRRHAARP